MDEFPPTIELDDTGWYQRHWTLVGYEFRSHQGTHVIRMSVVERVGSGIGSGLIKHAEYSRGYSDKTWVRIWLNPKKR